MLPVLSCKDSAILAAACGWWLDTVHVPLLSFFSDNRCFLCLGACGILYSFCVSTLFRGLCRALSWFTAEANGMRGSFHHLELIFCLDNLHPQKHLPAHDVIMHSWTFSGMCSLIWAWSHSLAVHKDSNFSSSLEVGYLVWIFPASMQPLDLLVVIQSSGLCRWLPHIATQ